MRKNNPEAISNRSESATCPPTRALPMRKRPPRAENCATLSFRVGATLTRVAAIAGMSPNSIPLRIETAPVKANTRTSTPAAR